jgi:type II secretory pathway pseudopilin PulG
MGARPYALRRRSAVASLSRAADTEAGDTLIEILITIVIISLAAVALLGALTTSITGSSEHSSLASIDTLLRSYAESAKEQIQLQQLPTSTDPTPPLFKNSCSATYDVTFADPTGYSLSISAVHFWNPTNRNFSDAQVACVQNNDDTTLQQITVLGRAPNNVSDTLSFVVSDPEYANPAPAAAVSVLVVPTAPTPGATITFSATVAPPGGTGPAPTGNVAWSFGPGTPMPTACANSALTPSGANAGTATCAVDNAKTGTYAVTATYLGDDNYQSQSASDSVIVAMATPTLSVTAPATSPVGQPLTFTATVSGPSGDPTPAGAVSWTLTPPGTCVSAPPTKSANVLTVTCTITPAAAGTYTAAASIAADSSYNAAGPSTPPAAVTVS